MKLEHTSQCELVTRNVAGSPWEAVSQVSSTIQNVHRKVSRPTAQEELCNYSVSFSPEGQPEGQEET